MKKLTPITALAVTLVIMAAVATDVKPIISAINSKLFGNDQSQGIDAGYSKYAKEMSSKLPMMVDQETRLDSVRYENKTLKMSYTVMHASSSLSESDKAVFSKAMLSRLKTTICTREQTKPLLDSGGAVQMSYFAQDDTRLSDDLLIDTKICQK